MANRGYESGDGSAKTCPAGSRGKPVDLAGTDFTGAAEEVAAGCCEVVVVNTGYAG